MTAASAPAVVTEGQFQTASSPPASGCNSSGGGDCFVEVPFVDEAPLVVKVRVVVGWQGCQE